MLVKADGAGRAPSGGRWVIEKMGCVVVKAVVGIDNVEVVAIGLTRDRGPVVGKEPVSILGGLVPWTHQGQHTSTRELP